MSVMKPFSNDLVFFYIGWEEAYVIFDSYLNLSAKNSNASILKVIKEFENSMSKFVVNAIIPTKT